MADTYWDLFLGYSLLWGLIFLLFVQLVVWQRRIDSRLSKLESAQVSS